MARKHHPALNMGLRGHCSGLHPLLVLYSPAPGLRNILAHNRSLRAICSCQRIFGRSVPSSVLVVLCLPALCPCLPSCRTPWAVGFLWDSFQVPNLCPPFLAPPSLQPSVGGELSKHLPPERKTALSYPKLQSHRLPCLTDCYVELQSVRGCMCACVCTHGPACMRVHANL